MIHRTTGVRAALRHTGALDPINASTDRFLRTVEALTQTEAGGPTLIPPWTRGHVITHAARAADSLCRLLTWARIDVETPPYAEAVSLAEQFPGGMLLTYEGLGHTAYGRGDACVTAKVDGYLVGLKRIRPGATCREGDQGG
ncbi:alpha/beta hydrolase [Streptomyces sp. cmx-18-6]|uniref:alpha/beta hydrolase n=1 Tax=Streptomyces sp. cmx-18-6 TaxID=2790930 RepID=UPI0039810607